MSQNLTRDTSRHLARGNSPPRTSLAHSTTMPRFATKAAAAAAAAAPDTPPLVNSYEAERAARIIANKARMQSLGLLDTSKAIADAANAQRVAARNARGSGGGGGGASSNRPSAGADGLYRLPPAGRYQAGPYFN